MSRLLTTVRIVFRQPRFVGLLFTCFVLGLAHAFVQPYLSLWGEQKVGLDKWDYGLFMAVTTLSGVILNTVFARWSDTFMARRTVLLIGAAGGTIGYLGYGYVSNFVALYFIGTFAVGLTILNFSQLFAHVGEELKRPGYDPEAVPFLMSVLRVFFSFAWIGGPAVASSIMVKFDFSGLFTAATIIYVVFSAGVLIFVQARKPEPTTRAAAQLPLLKVLTRPDILIYFLGFTLVFTTHTISLTILPLLVRHELSGTERDIANIFGLAPAFELPLMLWFGKLAQNGRQRGLIQLGVAANMLYFVGVSLAQAPWHVYPCQLLWAVTIAITTNITITFFQNLLPGQAGVATSLFGNAYSLGVVLAYMIVMLWGELLGNRGLFHLCAALVGTALVAFMVRARRADAAAVPMPAQAGASTAG
jgi:MFS transporter, SET family, sugar efflux transporter